jgi:hypothetical protein
MSVLRAAAIEGLRRAVRRRRLVVAADHAALGRARRAGKLVIDARLVADHLVVAEPEFARYRANTGSRGPRETACDASSDCVPCIADLASSVTCPHGRRQAHAGSHD